MTGRKTRQMCDEIIGARTERSQDNARCVGVHQYTVLSQLECCERSGLRTLTPNPKKCFLEPVWDAPALCVRPRTANLAALYALRLGNASRRGYQ